MPVKKVVMKKGLIALVFFLVTGGVFATPTQSDLARLEKELAEQQRMQEQSKAKSLAVSSEIAKVQKQMVQAAKTVQAQETEIEALGGQLKDLDEQEKELTEKLHLTGGQMVGLVTALQNLALRPKEALFFSQETPVNQLRARLLMNYAVPVVGGRQAELQKDLKTLFETKERIQDKKEKIQQATERLEEKNAHMSKLIRQKSVLQAQYDLSHQQAKKRAEELAAQAKDLKDLLAKLEAERKKKLALRPVSAPPLGTGAFAKSYGALILPTQGKIVQHFGDTTVSGAHLKGMTIGGRINSPVVAPFDGTVLFSGPFKSYGQMLIVDNGDDYMTLVAGLGEMTTSVGQVLVAGEPVGRMGPKGGNLYVEIRKNGQAIEPEPWFAGH